MKKELQDILFNKYDSIFSDRNKSSDQTRMCDGICTGDGWFKLIDDLCADISMVANCGEFCVTAKQVKQKFGQLRFYYRVEGSCTVSARRILDCIVSSAEERSVLICEYCGGYATTRTSGLYSNVCEQCYKLNDTESGDE